MSANRKPYKVVISGEIYSLISDETEESVMRAARLVDERVARILHVMPSKDLKKATTLAALQLASELLVLENQKESDFLKAQALADVIEEMVAGPECAAK